MARLRLSEREIHVLRSSLATALDESCLPDWEFESLIGCSRGQARRSLEAGLRRIEQRGERPAASACERMLLLLSASRGAATGPSHEVEDLIERLAVQDRSPLESGVALRGDVVPRKRAR